MHKRLLTFALVGMLSFHMVGNVSATSISDVQYQKNKTQSNLNNVNEFQNHQELKSVLRVIIH